MERMTLRRQNPGARFSIWTDGSCLSNPGVGAWAYMIQDVGSFPLSARARSSMVAIDWEAQKKTTNNRMELWAVIRALTHLMTIKHFSDHTEVNLYTDSMYVQKGITLWVIKWKKRGFKGIKNSDLWKILLDIKEQYAQWEVDLSFYHVQAHGDVLENNIVDRIAHRAATGLQKSLHTTTTPE